MGARHIGVGIGIAASLVTGAGAATPVRATRNTYMDARGPLVGGFLTLKTNLNDFIAGSGWPDPLEIAMNAYDDTVAALEGLEQACNFGHGIDDEWDAFWDAASDLIECPFQLALVGINAAIDTFEAFVNLVWETTVALAKAVVRSYVRAWIEDIDWALYHWGEFGLATTSGLFDAQSRRDLQYEECNHLPAGTTVHRNRRICVTRPPYTYAAIPASRGTSCGRGCSAIHELFHRHPRL